MNRAYLALVQDRLKKLEKAQYALAEAQALGIGNYGQGPVLDARRNLRQALDAWRDTLDPELTLLKEAA